MDFRNFMVSIEMKKKRNEDERRHCGQIFLKPAKLSGLTTRFHLKSEKRKSVKVIGGNEPEFVSLKALNKELVSPYALRTIELAKLSSSFCSVKFDGASLPCLPSTQIRLKQSRRQRRVFQTKSVEGSRKFYYYAKGNEAEISRLNENKINKNCNVLS